MSKIATRSSWGARYRNGVGTRPVGSLEKYLHHSVTTHLSANATVAQERAEMRKIESIGQQRFGAGISYTFLIFPSGRIYEGAGVNRISYHSGSGRNTRGVGVCLAGNYESNGLGSEAFDALVWLLQHGVEKGWWGDPALTEAHRDFRATSCPGKHAYNRMGDVNKAGRGGKVTPPKSSGGSSSSSSGGGSKSVSQMASEVIAGKHGQGHTNRRRSLGVSQSVYNQVRAEVNRRAGVSTPSRSSSGGGGGKSVSQMATEVINGKHGNGHATRRRSLGVSQSVYNRVRAEVNRRASGGSSGGGGKSISQMATEVLAGKHGNGHNTRRRSLGISAAQYARVRAEVNRRA